MASDVLNGATAMGSGGATSATIRTGQAQDASRPRTEDTAIGNQHHPLFGVVLCCTAIPTETRSALAEAAAPLGATHALDLTAAVTHLLVGHWDTAKYAFVARARPDVRVLQPSFIEAAREQWMAGSDDVDVAALEEAHAYPPLQGALICVTGLGDADERRAIEARVNDAGGNYTGDLTKDVTHLIAAKPEGAKYIHARQWKIRVTVLQWLWDSLERGMLLDSSYYDPLLPESEIGRGSFIQPSNVPTKAAKRKTNEDPAPARKLRRTASAKFSSQNENIWGDIVGNGVTDPKPEKQDAWAEDRVGQSFRSDRSRETMPQRTVSEGSINQRPQNDRDVTVDRQGGGLFNGTNVFLCGFSERETAVLERHLRTHGATLFEDASNFARAYTIASDLNPPSDRIPFLILVPHSLHPLVLPSPLDRLDPRPPLATDFYLEATLHARKRLPISTTPLHLPLPGALSGFTDLSLCATGFADAELLHLAKAIGRFGATYNGTLRREANALLCREPEGTAAEQKGLLREVERRDKVKFARIHGLPVLRAGWLWECAKQGRRVSWKGWELDGQSQRSQTAAGAVTTKHDMAPKMVQEPSKLPAPPPPRSDTTTINEAPAAAARAGNPIAIADTTHTSPLKPRDAPVAATTKDASLAAALSTLLAARSRSTTHSFSADVSASGGTSFATRDDEGGGIGAGATRRRRTLLGRAASGASIRSVGSANTDGVGTPVEGAASAGGGGGAVTQGGLDGASVGGAGDTDSMRDNDDDTNAHKDHDEEQPQLTQVGYADIPAKEWRKQIEARMGGGKEGEGSEVGEESRNEKDAADELATGGGGDGGNDLGRRSSRRIRDEVPALAEGDATGDARRVLRRRG